MNLTKVRYKDKLNGFSLRICMSLFKLNISKKCHILT